MYECAKVMKRERNYRRMVQSRDFRDVLQAQGRFSSTVPGAVVVQGGTPAAPVTGN